MDTYVGLPGFETSDRVFRTAAERAQAAVLPAQVKQKHLMTMLVKYPGYKKALEWVQHFHLPVHGGTHGVGVIGGLVGEQRGGKSYVVRNYVASLGNLQTDEAAVPRAIYINVGDHWYAPQLAEALYESLGLVAVHGVKVSTMFATAVAEIAQHGVQLLVLDDVQFLLRSPQAKTVKETFGFLVGLSERRCCNVLLVGTEEIELAARANKHAEGRGGFPRESVLPYSWSTAEGRENFLFLLKAIDDRLPFAEPSGLSNPVIAAHLYRISSGLIGRVMNVVVDAAFAALRDRSDRVEVGHLKYAAEQRLSRDDRYVPFGTKLDFERPVPDKSEDDLLDKDPRPTLSKRRRRSAIG